MAGSLPSPRSFSFDQYSIGWVAPLALPEGVAARAVLDEIHGDVTGLGTTPHDLNVYTHGAIGNLKVVIATLPKTEGTGAAARVASNMVRTYTNIKVVMLVGVGGGVPGRQMEGVEGDIRLGDVVVSMSSKESNAVVQHDYGKTNQGQNFELTKWSFDKPPESVRAAFGNLQIKHELASGNGIAQKIKQIIDGKKLPQKYNRPSGKGIAFKAEYVHRNRNQQCNGCCSFDEINLLQLDDREDPSSVAVHYGTIGCGNQVVKDSVTRDELATEHRIIAFEMESAGMMDGFPCVVIRGICDYADSHKNNIWQPYAALAAAVYAKELILSMNWRTIARVDPISEALLTDKIKEISGHLKRIEQQDILDWLTPIDFASRQNDIISRRHKGTGKWLLFSKEFQTWLTQNKGTLFCSGIPGAGKTMMSSIVVEYLDDLRKERNEYADIGIAFIYCSYQLQQEQSPTDLFSSLLKQLASDLPALPTDLKPLYEKHNLKSRPSLDEIATVLHSTIRLYSRVFVVIDALDEYFDLNKAGYDRFLSKLFSLQNQVQLNLFATSRPMLGIRSRPEFHRCMNIEIRANNDDILSYINGRMHELLLGFSLEHEEVKGNIRRNMVKAADGMFLLVRLHMDSLADCPTIGDLKRMLQKLPQGITGLDETYERAIKRIEGQREGHQKLAKRVLAWITYAKRALHTDELRHALAVQMNATELDKDFLPEVKIIGSICCGLVTIDEESDIIRLVHYTTQEYLKRMHVFPNAERDIATTCVTYLSFKAFDTPLARSQLKYDQLEARLKSYKLYEYAAQNWGHHARAALETGNLIPDMPKVEAAVSSSSREQLGQLILDHFKNQTNISRFTPMEVGKLVMDFIEGKRKASTSQANLKQLMIDFLRSTAQAALSCCSLLPIMTRFFCSYTGEEQLLPTGRVGVHLAAYFGLEEAMEIFLRDGQGVDSGDVYERTPLSIAIEYGHEKVVKVLLDKGAGVNTPDRWEWDPPLLMAAGSGHEAVARLLLEKGAQVDGMVDGMIGCIPPLFRAAINGHEAVARLLLEKGAQVNPETLYGKSPLSISAEHGHEVIVQLLLERGAEINTTDNRGESPLSHAARNGHVVIAQLLLEKGAEVNTTNNSGESPLSHAAEREHEVMVQLLLEKGAEVNIINVFGNSLLLQAAQDGYEAVARLLLEKGARVDAKNLFNESPLLFAAQYGHEAVVRLLLEKGAEVEAMDDLRRTPLFWATKNGHNTVAQLLREKGDMLRMAHNGG
ncbi:ankyrin repeat [Drechslerella dactyloides]|uniref:Ankyrin repeat n=1 Tax=Drechslerella dactyloides TaxID=74499 RepID=A0AAD6NJ52_DREDA|nr:ankyrin repeat [Drechslerella dactyloides]